jgi:hypothetical protein
MVRADRIALGVGSLVGRAALGLIGLMIAVGAFVPPNEPASRSPSEPGDPAQSAITVTLRIPAGEPAGHVTVVDASGRELARVTRWYNDDVAVVAQREAGVGVYSYLNVNGKTDVSVIGTARQTDIFAQPDGTAKVSVSNVPPGFNAFGKPRTTDQGLPVCDGPSILGSVSDIRH